MERLQEFEENSRVLQESVVKGAAYAINLQLLDKKRHVRLFAEEYARLFLQLSSHPKDEKTEANIKYRLQQRFPDFFTFTIADQNAMPILFDIESLVGDVCQIDLTQFSKDMGKNNRDVQNKVFIHPNPDHYHYDIMTPLFTNGLGTSIFFISFYLKEITDILKTHELPGQNLMLVRQSKLNLIEVSSEGARDIIKRKIELSEDEMSRIEIYKNIPDSDWRLVSLPDESYKKNYIKGLWMEAIAIAFSVSLALLLLIFALIKLPANRKKISK